MINLSKIFLLCNFLVFSAHAQESSNAPNNSNLKNLMAKIELKKIQPMVARLWFQSVVLEKKIGRFIHLDDLKNSPHYRDFLEALDARGQKDSGVYLAKVLGSVSFALSGAPLICSAFKSCAYRKLTYEAWNMRVFGGAALIGGAITLWVSIPKENEINFEKFIRKSILECKEIDQIVHQYQNFFKWNDSQMQSFKDVLVSRGFIKLKNGLKHVNSADESKLVEVASKIEIVSKDEVLEILTERKLATVYEIEALIEIGEIIAIIQDINSQRDLTSAAEASKISKSSGDEPRDIKNQIENYFLFVRANLDLLENVDTLGFSSEVIFEWTNMIQETRGALKKIESVRSAIK